MGKYLKNCALSATTIFLITGWLYTPAEAGITNGFEFMLVDYSPRSSALAGSNLTLNNDISTLFLNPAGLAQNTPGQMSFNYANYLLDINGGLAAYSYPVPILGKINMGIIYMNYGSFKETDENAVETGRNFSANDLLISVGTSNTLAEHYSYGINLKYAFSAIDQFNASAIALDFGLIYETPFIQDLKIAVTLLNVGGNFEYYDQNGEPLPVSLNIGGSKKLERLPLELSFSLLNLTDYAEDISDYIKRFAIGGEFMLSNSLRLRLGYNNRLHDDLRTTTEDKFGGLSAGVGFEWRTLRFDYAYSNFSTLGNIHRFGVTGTLW